MDISSSNREELIALVKQIQDLQDQGKDFSKLLSNLQLLVRYPNVKELFSGDHSAEYIVELSLAWRQHWPKLSRNELIDLVSKIMNAEGTEATLSIMTKIFDENCIFPAKSDLIYYPEKYFGDNFEPSAAQIVEKALEPPSK